MANLLLVEREKTGEVLEWFVPHHKCLETQHKWFETDHNMVNLLLVGREPGCPTASRGAPAALFGISVIIFVQMVPIYGAFQLLQVS